MGGADGAHLENNSWTVNKVFTGRVCNLNSEEDVKLKEPRDI